MILAIRTDKPEAELHLVDTTGAEAASFIWEAHRSLATTLLTTILQFLSQHGVKPKELEGLIVFTGSGSFTGLRIGATVMNALAYSHGLPIAVGEKDEWIKSGLQNLKTAQPGNYVIPTYDREPNITKPR